MPTVILHAVDVDAAAERAMSARASKSGFTRTEDRADEALSQMRQCAAWLMKMNVGYARIGLTLEEAELIESFLPLFESKDGPGTRPTRR